MMKTASITETKASLSEYVRLVKQTGNEVLITERGKVVARICPPHRTDTPEEIRMAQLEQDGLVKVGEGRLPDGFWDMPAPRDRNSAAVKALIAEREEGL
ncbi:MAG: type II toxin-antitoxin system Phd/YefM family antitoxin [Candidatus Micrarchaeaceae archaeon]